MIKRIVKALMLACVVVPTFARVKNAINSPVGPKSMASSLYDAVYAGKAKMLDLTSEDRHERINKEEEGIAADIQATKALLAELERRPGNSARIATLRSELNDLMRRRERSIASCYDQVVAMDEERLEAERYFLVKRRSDAEKAEWKSLTKIAKIETAVAKNTARARQESAAATVNRFFEAVENNDVETVRNLSTASLRSEIGFTRVRSMRRNAPERLENGFELRDGGRDRLEVWVDKEKKIATLCSLDDRWLFEEAW